MRPAGVVRQRTKVSRPCESLLTDPAPRRYRGAEDRDGGCPAEPAVAGMQLLEEVRVPLSVSPRPHRRGSLALAMLALFGLVIPAGVFAARPPAPPPVNIQVLNVSDWHSNIDAQGSSTTLADCSVAVPCGLGSAWGISAYWDADEAAFSGPTLRLTAGDDFGASPPLAGFFDEVPGVLAERMMEIDVNTFGNHDFDKGIAHLQSMIDLAGAPTDADHPGQPFTYVAANLKNLTSNLTGVDPIKYFTLGGAKVAVIGIVNEEAPGLVSPGNFGTMVVTDGVAAANKFAAVARKAGANAVLVITHKGVADAAVPNGSLIDFANGLTPGLVDVVYGDHTNVKFSGTVNGVLVHENGSYGVSYAKTELSVQPGKGGGVLAKSVSFADPKVRSLRTNNTLCPVPAGAATDPSRFCDQAIVDMLIPYRVALAAALDGQITTTTAPFDRGGNIERRQEVALGDLIADGMRTLYGTQFGFMNGGGIRTQFPTCIYSPVNHALNRAQYAADHTTITTCAGYGTGTPLDIVKGDVYSVMPFGNNVLTRTVTGTQLWQMLENGVSVVDPVTGNGIKGRVPQVSGFKFTFHYANPTGCTGPTGDPTDPVWTGGCVPSRVTAVTFPDGTPIPYDATTYTLATIDFLNTGGDGYTMLKDGQGTTRDRDANAFLAYLATLGPLDPSSFPLDRITKLP